MRRESQATAAACGARRRGAAPAATLGLLGVLGLLAPAAEAGAAAAAGAAAEIELRKSFGAAPRPGTANDGGPARSSAGTPAPARRAAPDAERPAPPPDRRPAGVAAALGETLVGTGTLHLPEVGGPGLALEVARTPFVELPGGRRAILDTGGLIPPGTAAEISRRWPGFVVIGVPAGGGLRDLLDALLAASGYASVQRGASLTFGRDATVQVRPDYVILKRDDDLLDGETRTLSVVDAPAAALPPELRELASGHGIRIEELAGDGTLLGQGPARWREPVGTVITVQTRSPTVVLAELSEALGLRLRRDELPRADGTRAGLAAAVGELIRGSGVAALGPRVEFSRPVRPGERSPFTISVPGWLATRAGARRLLVTGAALPEPLRLLLQRESIDVFVYRLSGR